MVITDLQVEDKSNRPRFFQEIFLVADTKFEVVLGMFFLKISNADISFGEKIISWKFYTTNKVILTTKQVQLIDSKKFIYNNAKNASTSYKPFELNCKYYLCIFYEKDLDSCSKLRIAEKPFSKLQELMAVCQQNLYHAQKLQKQAHNKGVKPQSYASGNKVWLIRKHLKNK